MAGGNPPGGPVNPSPFDASMITPEMARAELERRKASPTAQIAKYDNKKDRMRGMAMGARNTLGGLLDAADFVLTPVREAINLAPEAAGSNWRLKPMAEDIIPAIDTATGDYTKPQTPEDKVMESGVRTISGMPLGGAMGKVAQVAGATMKGKGIVPSLVKGAGNFLTQSNALKPVNIAAQGATSAAMQHYINENPGDTFGAMAYGSIPGLLIPALAKNTHAFLKNGPQTYKQGIKENIGAMAGKALNVVPEKVKHFKEAGLHPLLSDVSSSPYLKTLTTGAEKIPYVGKPITTLTKSRHEKILQGLGQEANGLPMERTEAASLVSKGAKSYQQKKQSEFGPKFDEVEADINKMKNQDVSIKPVDDIVDNLTRNIKTSTQSKDFLNSPVGKEYIKLRNTSIEHGARMDLETLKLIYPSDFINGGPSNSLYKKYGGNVPYSQAKDAIDAIEDMISTHGLIGKKSQGKLKTYAGSIAKAIQEGMGPKFAELGEKAYKNWKEVSPLYAQYAKGEVPAINEIYKKVMKGDVGAFKDLVGNLKNSGVKPRIVMEGLNPKERENMSKAIIGELGRGVDGKFNPNKWAKEYSSLGKDAKEILLSGMTAENRKRVDYIAKAIGNIKETLAEANTSNTAYHNRLGALVLEGTHATWSALAGNPTELMIMASGLLGGRAVTSKLLANPKFITWIDRGMKAKSLSQIEKIIRNYPKNVGELSKTLATEVKTFQHDLELAKKENEKK
jgi:hypothetical protein